MNFKATASSIAASGGIRPDSHITARPVTARKAGPVALGLAGVIEGRPGDIPARSDLSPSSTFPFLCRTTVYHRYYAERTARQGTSHRYAYALADCRGGKSLTGQRRYTDERERVSERFGLMLRSRRATSRSGGGYGLWPATALCKTSPHYRRHLGNPCVEKAGACRSRSILSL